MPALDVVASHTLGLQGFNDWKNQTVTPTLQSHGDRLTQAESDIDVLQAA